MVQAFNSLHNKVATPDKCGEEIQKHPQAESQNWLFPRSLVLIPGSHCDGWGQGGKFLSLLWLLPAGFVCQSTNVWTAKTGWFSLVEKSQLSLNPFPRMLVFAQHRPAHLAREKVTSLTKTFFAAFQKKKSQKNPEKLGMSKNKLWKYFSEAPH